MHPYISFFFIETVNYQRRQNDPKIQQDEVESLLAKLTITVKNRLMPLPDGFKSDTITPILLPQYLVNFSVRKVGLGGGQPPRLGS